MRNIHTFTELLPKNTAGRKSLASSIKKTACVRNLGLKRTVFNDSSTLINCAFENEVFKTTSSLVKYLF